MRKWLFLSLVVSVFCADFGAFAATARRGGGTVASNAQPATAARAATRGTVKKVNGSSQTVAAVNDAIQQASAAQAASTGNIAKRAAVNTGVKKPNGARAAATQKVINTGTKVSAATTNTTISQECQDAYFGCMDAFCMLDNTSGGRCQCSDRNAELDKVLAEIVKLDEQSYALATEGVERLQMGQNADEIIARAKDAENSVVNKDKIAEENKKKSRQLNLDAWNNNVLFSDDEAEDIFEVNASLQNEMSNKTGDALHNAAAKMCATQMPKQCAASASMLQLVYAQKIRSDCSAYENSLKQQKSASAQKLQTAQKALRDTALEQYQNENKYDLGQCTIRFKQCMQDTGGCGDDFTGCVTLAAAENVKTSATDNTSKKKAKQTTIKGAVSSITLAASTIDQITAKKPLCESVLSQCVKVKDNVWNTFLADVAPTLKSAELIAEDNLRMNCISDVSQCFQKACKEYMDPKNPNGSYDMCLSDPMLVVDLCKVKLEPCIYATGGKMGSKEDIRVSRLWKGVEARLAAMRVDACTSEVKACLTSDDACGADYSQCIGLDTYTIGNLCPADKLTACMAENSFGKNAETDIRNYVASVAQGIALNIDNNMLTTCQNALKTAMVSVCGAEDSCPNAVIKEDFFANNFSVKPCLLDDNGDSTDKCFDDLFAFTEDDILEGKVAPTLLGQIDFSDITVDETENDFSATGTEEKKIADSLSRLYTDKIKQIESDPKIEFCMTGRKVQGFKESDFVQNKTEQSKGRFDSLTASARRSIQEILLNNAIDAYHTQLNAFLETKPYDKVTKGLEERIDKLVKDKQAYYDTKNKALCNYNDPPNFRAGWGRKTTWSLTKTYDSATAQCITDRKTYNCKYYLSPYCWDWEKIGHSDEGYPKVTQMEKYERGAKKTEAGKAE